MPDALDAFLDSTPSEKATDALDAFLDSPQEKPKSFRDRFMEAAGAIPATGKKIGRGFARGLIRKDTGQASGLENVAEIAGRAAPSIAGSLAAGAVTGGTGLFPALAAQAIGSGGGELAGQMLGRAAGGENPGALESALGVGGAALAGAGGEGLARGAKAALPVVAQTFTKIRARALERAMERGGNIPSGSQAELETRALPVLKSIQDRIAFVRRGLGKAIGKAEDVLANSAQAAGKSVNLGPAAQAAEDAIAETATNPLTAGLFPDSDMKIVSELIDRMRKAPSAGVKDAVHLRRTLDDLTDFTRGAVGKVTSDAAQRALRSAASAVRAELSRIANETGATGFLTANAKFGNFAKAWDEYLGPIFGTKNTGDLALTSQATRIRAMLDNEGAKGKIVESIGNVIPGGAKKVTELFDILTGSHFGMRPSAAPSGLSMDVVRSIAAPKVVGSVAKNFKNLARVSAPGSVLLFQIGRSIIRVPPEQAQAVTNSGGKFIGQEPAGGQ